VRCDDGGSICLLKTGGLAIYPLLFLSVISWAIAIERLINLRSSNFLSKNLKEAKSLLRSGDLEGAIKLLSLDTSLEAKPF
jgi:biopolymer transport protein ExbB